MLFAQQPFDPWKQTNEQKIIKTFWPQKALVLQTFWSYFPVTTYPEMKGISKLVVHGKNLHFQEQYSTAKQ